MRAVSTTPSPGPWEGLVRPDRQVGQQEGAAGGRGLGLAPPVFETAGGERWSRRLPARVGLESGEPRPGPELANRGQAGWPSAFTMPSICRGALLSRQAAGGNESAAPCRWGGSRRVLECRTARIASQRRLGKSDGLFTGSGGRRVDGAQWSRRESLARGMRAPISAPPSLPACLSWL
jgi:hypothetical protein